MRYLLAGFLSECLQAIILLDLSLQLLFFIRIFYTFLLRVGIFAGIDSQWKVIIVVFFVYFL